MKDMFDELMQAVKNQKSNILDCSEISQEDNPQGVEKIFQKYESEIRAHIKMEKEYK